MASVAGSRAQDGRLGGGEGRNGATSAKAMKDLAEVQGVLSFGVAGDKPGIKGMPGMGRRCFYQKTCGMK